MPDDWLNGATPSEVFTGFAFKVLRCFGRWRFRQDYRCVSHALSSPKASVTERRFRSAAPDVRNFGKYLFERIAVVFVTGEILRPDADTAGFGHDNGGFGAELVFLMLFALADAADLRLMEAVNLFGVPALLVDGLAINVYGPNEYHKGAMRSVVFKAVSRIQETGRLGLFKSDRPDYESGGQKRDFVYVKDCAALVCWFHEHGGVNGVFNVGTGQTRSWNELARAVFTYMDRSANIEDMWAAIPPSVLWKTA